VTVLDIRNVRRKLLRTADVAKENERKWNRENGDEFTVHDEVLLDVELMPGADRSESNSGIVR
jgi:hypothetical protein